jgi:putative ABC transport system permease protein
LVLPLGLFRLARDPLQPSQVVLLVSLTAGLVLFTRTFGDALATGQEALRSDALAQGIRTALQLNALTLVLFSVTAFFLVHFVAAQGRGREFGVLRAMGLSARQMLALSVTEGMLMLLLGLLAGTFVGWGLSHIMIPYLSQPLAESLAGVTIERIRVDWSAVAQLYVLLIGVYGSALVLLSWVLMRTQVHRAPWRGDE